MDTDSQTNWWEKMPDKFNKCPNHHKQKTRTTDDSPCTETGHNVIHQTNQKLSPTHTHPQFPLSILSFQTKISSFLLKNTNFQLNAWNKKKIFFF